MFTEMSESFAKGDRARYARQLSSGMSQIMFVLIPFMLYLIVFSRPLMSLLRIGQFDAESANLTASYLSSLALCLPFYGLSTFFQKTFSSMRKMVPFAVANIIASVAQVVFTVAATPYLGIHAVSLGSLLYMVVLDLISLAQIRRDVPEASFRGLLGSFLRALGLGVAGAALGGLISFAMGGMGTLTVGHALVVLVCGGVVAVAVTFGAAIALKLPEAAFLRRMVSHVTGKLRRA